MNDRSSRLSPPREHGAHVHGIPIARKLCELGLQFRRKSESAGRCGWHWVSSYPFADKTASSCKTTRGSSRRGGRLMSLPITVKHKSLNRRTIYSSSQRVILMHVV